MDEGEGPRSRGVRRVNRNALKCKQNGLKKGNVLKQEREEERVQGSIGQGGM